MQLIDLVADSDLTDGHAIACAAGTTPVLICKVAGRLYAMENRCSHANSIFDAGPLRGFAITCPLHGARFDVRDGKALSLPAKRGLNMLEVSVQAGRVCVLAP